jgi:hydrogenase nickel incorporation protein HypA/HybF
MSIAQSLVAIIQEEMITHGARNLKSVRLQVGRMSAVVPDSLSFCFEIVTAGTDLEGAELIIEVIPLKARCQGCGRSFVVEEHLFACPHCDGAQIDVTEGQELSIVEIEVDDERGDPA